MSYFEVALGQRTDEYRTPRILHLRQLCGNDEPSRVSITNDFALSTSSVDTDVAFGLTGGPRQRGRLNSRRDDTPSLAKIRLRCHSTMGGLMNGWLAISEALDEMYRSPSAVWLLHLGR